ncbi:uncharacterized protein LOC142973490 isoform X2 [Anticarsia gemmatalis]|uniref:uncharacterized protein LOC142973490 isoform X2 n=1 Tax=Anticarsia gemmatalis TaxID=129554 RepID=UPI003F77392B
MAWTLNLLVLIVAVAATAYKYPSPQQPRYPRFPSDSEDTPDRVEQDTITSEHVHGRHESRMSERSIVNPPRTHQDGVRVFNPMIEEPSLRRADAGSSKVFINLSQEKKDDVNRIVFPGPTIRAGFVPEIPEKCKESTFCEDIPDYPQAEIDRLIIEEGIRPMLDSTDEKSGTPDIAQRVGGPFERNIELCKFTSTVVYPQAVKGIDGKWYTLVNSKKKPVQGFRVEVCDENSPACSPLVIIQSNYRGSCEQKYMFRTVTVVEQLSDGTLRQETKRARLPSCCSCMLSSFTDAKKRRK